MEVEFTFYENQRIYADGSEYQVLGGIEFYNSHDSSRWKEYRLRETGSGQERWLSIDNLYEEYAIYTQQVYSEEFSPDQMSRSGYRSADSGRAKVVSCFGAVDVEPGDWVDYEEYEDSTEENLMSIEQWEDEKEYSKGYYLDADEISPIDNNPIDNSFAVSGEDNISQVVAKWKRTAFLGLMVLAVIGIIMTVIPGRSQQMKKAIKGNSAFTYKTSITSDLNPKEKADVYETYLTVDEAVKLILREIEGSTEEVQADENGESVAILTKKEYCLVYLSEEQDTLVQISSRAYAFQSTNHPYHSSSPVYRHYRSFYYTWGLPGDRSTYAKSRNGYEGYDDEFLKRDSNDFYRNYSNSIRQSSVNTRRSSGGGISSGK